MKANDIILKIKAVPEKVAKELKVTIVDTLTGERHGRWYKGATNRSSAPGEPPAVQTDNLRSSFVMEKDGNSYIIGTAVEYAKYLEFGTKKMAPRPYVKPSINKLVNKYNKGK
ncbi:MAG: hypothetical protein IJS60_08795 [Abditibacteriota bacterium]|nr:hypothetical protein [Abditibacteriota bacterium]